MPSTIVHGDWHFWNQFYRGDEVICITDFDFLHHGRRILDIAYSLWVIYTLLPRHSATFDRSFLTGYGSLADEEKDVLSTAVAQISLFFLLQTAYSQRPKEKWSRKFPKQEPLIRWLLSDYGEKRLRELANG